MKKNSFINGALIATAAIVITKILGIVYVIPFYAIIGESNIALYGYAYTIYNLFLSLSTVGIPPAMSKLISEYNTLGFYHTKERAYKLGKYLLIGLGVILFIIMFFGAPFIAYQIMGNNTGGNSKESITFVIRVISTAILVVPFLSVTKGYLQGHKFIAPSSYSQVIEQVVRIAVILIGSYLCVRVFNVGVTKAIGVAVFGATVGALVALIYLLVKIRKNKKDIIVNEPQKPEEKGVTNKAIIKKLLIYSVPFISFGLALSVYDYIDMTTIIGSLTNLGFKTTDAESILGVINTTGNKLNSVVLAISTGLMTSLVPNITASFVKGDKKDVKNKVQQSFLMLLYVTLPMAMGLSILSKPVFYAFYGASNWGPKVFCFTIFIALFRCVFTTSISIAQSLNKFKNVFLSIIAGILVKLVLQVPLMNLFSRLGIYPFYGSTLATLLGLSTSFITNLIVINKTVKLDIKAYFKKMFKFLYPLVIMIILLLVMTKFIPLTVTSRANAIILILIYGGVGALVYFTLTILNGTFKNVFGSRLINKLKK
ncbi:MAG: polysaccharide biosynthesis protein [Bacilli bacterium]|nr:polysaccharide biosynthesis protein [Bacilli bacterium]